MTILYVYSAPIPSAQAIVNKTWYRIALTKWGTKEENGFPDLKLQIADMFVCCGFDDHPLFYIRAHSLVLFSSRTH